MWVVVLVVVVLGAWVIRWQRSGQGLVDFLGLGLVNVYARLWHRWSSNGPAPLPPTGPAIVVTNHTCSSDPTFVVAGSCRRVGFLIAREYFRTSLLCRFFNWIHAVPVARDGKDVRAVRQALRTLKEGYVLCLFPEGGLSNAGRRGVRSARAGVALLALRSGVPVYPAAISGGPQMSNVLRAWLVPSAPTRVRITYGPPVDLSAYRGQPITRKLLDDTTRCIMQTIVDLGKPACGRLTDPAEGRQARKEENRKRYTRSVERMKP